MELLLLNFKAASLFVKLMDGATTITELVKEILDFISEVLVFTLNNIKLFNSLIPSSLQTEEFAVVVASFLVASINLSLEILNLGLPFIDNL